MPRARIHSSMASGGGMVASGCGTRLPDDFEAAVARAVEVIERLTSRGIEPA